MRFARMGYFILETLLSMEILIKRLAWFSAQGKCLTIDMRHQQDRGSHMHEIHEDDDERLLARINRGDMSAMKTLYERHSMVVHRFVQTRLRDHFEVADVVHNTMLDIWRNAGKFQGRSSVRSWILTIARNKSVDLIRKVARTDLSAPDETIPDDGPDAVAVIAAAQDADRVRDCVAKLGAHQRTAVHLAFYEELTYAEIAVVEKVPEGTIKTRIYHAKKLLMRCLSR